MILEVNKFKRESASHGSRVPFALLPFEHRSIKLLKQNKAKQQFAKFSVQKWKKSN